MSYVKTICLVCAAVAARTLSAGLAPCDASKWDFGPADWEAMPDGALRSTGIPGIAVNEAEAPGTKVSVSARVRPLAREGDDGWAVAGLAIAASDDDYWHIAMVLAPSDASGAEGRHGFELCEMMGGVWLSQQGLRRTRHRAQGRWEYGRDYDVSLSCDRDGISGSVRDAETGETVFETGFAFPDGEDGAVRGGRPALHANGGFRCLFSDIRARTSGAKAPPKFPAYASDSFVPGVAFPATGFFRVERDGDGRWWAVDPLGRGTAILGVDHVKYNGMYSDRSKRSPYLEANRRNFAGRAEWADDALAKMKSWGFTALGTGCDQQLRHRGLGHAANLAMGGSMCRPGVPQEFWICPDERHPCSAFPNVFHPKFAAWFDHVAKRKCAPNRDDLWFIGYFIDNELAWWGRGARDTGIYNAVSRLPDSHPAKIAQEKFLAKRGVTRDGATAELKLEFLKIAAERYFSVAAAAIRRHDPNHMVLGARFAGLNGAHPEAWKAAGRHCDIVTFNCYPWADLDRNAVFTDSAMSAATIADAFAERHELAGRPMMVTEWSFPALDTGRPCLYGAGQRFMTQQERTRATLLCARTMLSMPFLVGYDYFMWVDQPAEGLTDAFPEDSNYGLLAETGVPYPGITGAFARLHRDIGKWRRADAPAPRTAAPAPGLAAADVLAAFPADGAVQVSRDGESITLATSSGLSLTCAKGAKEMLRQISAAGNTGNTFNTMVCDIPQDGGLRWRDAGRVTGFKWHGGEGAGFLDVTAEGRSGANAFTVTQRFTPLAGMQSFLCELVRIENSGSEPLDVDSILFRQYARYGADGVDLYRAVPKLWKGNFADVWIDAKDGRWSGGFTSSRSVRKFSYFTTHEGRAQHPDAVFAPPASPFVLKPGGKFEPKGAAWMVAGYGTGGADGWREFLSRLEKAFPPR